MNNVWGFLDFIAFHGSQPRGSWNPATVLVQGCGTLAVMGLALIAYWLLVAR